MKSVYSQNGKDGVIKYIFENIGFSNKICVEFGFDENGRVDGIHYHESWITKNIIGKYYKGVCTSSLAVPPVSRDVLKITSSIFIIFRDRSVFKFNI